MSTYVLGQETNMSATFMESISSQNNYGLRYHTWVVLWINVLIATMKSGHGGYG